MKKIVSLLMAAAMSFSLVACGSSSTSTTTTTTTTEATAETTTTEATAETTATEEKTGSGKIGVSTITLGAEFFSQLDDAMRARFEADGYELVTLSCEGNAATQVTDIENLITMDVEAIFAFLVDPVAATDVLKKAVEAGIRVYPLATSLEDRDAYTYILGTDQYKTGTDCAEMTSAWIDATFPDAEDGSIEVAVIGNTQSTESIGRTTGMQTLADINSKVTIVEMFDLAGATNANIKAQEFSDIMTSKYPDLKVVMAYGVDSELGANEVFMRVSDLDREHFGIFGVDTSDVAYEQIKLSIDNESLIRGTVNLGDDLSLNTWNVFMGNWDDLADENGYIFTPCAPVTADNIDEFLK